ncbi:hypothetical protein H5P28_12855 [Ruficoccus amylovorans]|uniref:Lipocalin-like domain-containing protein n=1 Tax=Ruficoccus amylovorans TaxID=1804625 RepID=A0A842HG26_9BACT|nr:hypothetical protein [Ruficoccus amylovorans]MBC2595150.1 hypothetical protein [Ruficoccus amylovorans]
MKISITSFFLAALLLIPGLLRAQSGIDPAQAIIGTWVIDADASWEQFEKSPEWEAMTPDQRVDFRSTIWPKALEKLLFTAYHFAPNQIVIAHKDSQLPIPASYVKSEGRTLTVVMGEAPNTVTLTINFYNANQINIRSADELKPNYYVWVRRGKDRP